MKIWIAIALAALFMVNTDSVWAQKNNAQSTNKDKVYRWVDEEGNVHYTATLPPDFKDKKADVLDEQGLTRETDISLVPPPPKPKEDSKNPKGELPRDKSGMQRPDPIYNQEEMQRQSDALLVLRYHSEEEILDALQVEVRQLSYDSNLIEASRNSMITAYEGSLKDLADLQRAGLELPPEEIKAVEDMKRRMVSNDRAMKDIRDRETLIKQKFEADLERYRHLSGQAEEEPATTEPFEEENL